MNAKQADKLQHRLKLVNAINRRLREIGVAERERSELTWNLIQTGVPFLRQRKPGTKRKYRSIALFPDKGWTLNDVRRMLDKPW